MDSRAGADAEVTPVFFCAGGTGISAETLGNMIIKQFPSVSFRTEKIPFIVTLDQARQVVERLDAAMTDTVTPLVFTTVADEAVRAVLATTRCAVIDLFGSQLDFVERVLHVNAARLAGSAHGVGDVAQYDRRMKAVEFAIEHDDGQSLRAIDRADVILIAPSRCGKTPTTMYLALQHGLLVANYPLVEEDLESTRLPRPIAGHGSKVFGVLSTPGRLSQVRGERRPGSRYASLAQCTYELNRAEAMYKATRTPFINSATMSVEEMAALIVRDMHLRPIN